MQARGTERPAHEMMEVEVQAELNAPSAQVRLVRYRFAEPPRGVLHMDGKFRVELCLTARHPSARACFRDVWHSHRYERIGALFLVPPALEMFARSDEDNPFTSIICEFDRELTVGLFDSKPMLTDQHLLRSLDIREVKLRKLMLQLAQEARHPGLASEMLVESLASLMAVELFRFGAIAESVPGGLAVWQLRRIDERLKDVRKAPTQAELAALCRLSIRQLTRGFRASRGCTLGMYVAASQLEHVKQLLATDQSVAAIAATLGFSSASNFCLAFRRTMGMTPGQFRQTLLRH